MQKTVHNGCKENSRSVRAVIYDPLGTNDQLIASFSDFKHRFLGTASWIWAKLDPQYCKSQQVALLLVLCVCPPYIFPFLLLPSVSRKFMLAIVFHLKLILFLKTRLWAKISDLGYYEQMRWEDIQLWAVSGLPNPDQEEIKGMDYDNLNIDESPSILAITTMYQPTEQGWNKGLAIFSDLYVSSSFFCIINPWGSVLLEVQGCIYTIYIYSYIVTYIFD